MIKNYNIESEIRLVKVREMPDNKNVHEQLFWFADSLGLFNKRDKDKSCYRLFIAVIQSTKTKEMLSSDELAEKLKLSRATTIHHLKTLMKYGLVKHTNNKYILCSDSLIELIREVDNNYKRTLKQILTIAKTLDEELDLH